MKISHRNTIDYVKKIDEFEQYYLEKTWYGWGVYYLPTNGYRLLVRGGASKETTCREVLDIIKKKLWYRIRTEEKSLK